MTNDRLKFRAWVEDDGKYEVIGNVHQNPEFLK